jgi:type II secretory pathway pseudopilin PulG
MKQRNQNRNQAGYSLVEVTLALLVVAIGLVSTFALFPEGLKATRAAVDDTEVGLFADYVFSTLAVTAAAKGLSTDTPDARDGDQYASRVLSDADLSKKELTSGGVLSQFYWIARNNDKGTGISDLSSAAGFWSSAFTYELVWRKMDKGNNRDTYYAMLKVWPGDWQTIADPDKFPPYVFYREIIPYPDM